MSCPTPRPVSARQTDSLRHGGVFMTFGEPAPNGGLLMPLGFQEPLCLDGGHAAGAGCCDGLTIGAVLNVAGMKHTRHVGARTALRDDVAIRVELNLALERLGVRDVAN